MTREEAEEYAKEMTYRDAVYNALQGKCIPYRKSTLIKLYELLDMVEPKESEAGMTYKENITAILECYFTGFKKEIIDSACNRILEQEPKAEWIPIEWKPFGKNGYPKPEDEYNHFLTIDNKGEITIQEFLLSLDEEPQPYFTGMRKIIAWMPLPKPYRTESEEV